MRKRLIGEIPGTNFTPDFNWLDLSELAQVEITSEEPAHPIEDALSANGAGWRAGTPGEQTIRVLFDRPQTIRHIRLLFIVEDFERKQEFALFCAAGKNDPMREIVRQQYQFSPSGANRELETYHVHLEGVQVLELKINPDRDGNRHHASLARFLLA